MRLPFDAAVTGLTLFLFSTGFIIRGSIDCSRRLQRQRRRWNRLRPEQFLYIVRVRAERSVQLVSSSFDRARSQLDPDLDSTNSPSHRQLPFFRASVFRKDGIALSAPPRVCWN
jgi:hypothetical protein